MNNKQLANRVLVFTALVFLAALYGKHYFADHFVVKVIYAISEAGLVGGIADWFAITALFDRPLGLRWHTRLIPNNRTKLVKATAQLVTQELLSKENIRQKISNLNMTYYIIHWMEYSQGKEVIIRFLQQLSKTILIRIDSKKTAIRFEKYMKIYAYKVNLHSFFHPILGWILQNKYDDFLINGLINELLESAQKTSTKQQIKVFLENEQHSDHVVRNLMISFLEGIKIINYDEASTVLQQQFVTCLQDLQQVDHPLRLWLKEQLKQTLLSLATDNRYEQILERWKREIISNIELTSYLEIKIDALKQEKSSGVDFWIEKQFEKLWYSFISNDMQQRTLEAFLQDTLGRIVESEHIFIGILVKKAFQVFSDEDLNQFVRDKAGQDLQWIRINGALVGSVVGLFLFLFLHFLYYPWIVPIVRSVVT